MTDYFSIAASVPGWREGEEAAAVYEASYSCPADAIIVEIGAFLGRSTILLAGARERRGSGRVHCIDPFDCSGDAFSVPIYRQILASIGGGALRDRFDDNIRLAGVAQWVEVHQHLAAAVAMTWRNPIDLLLLDGDQTPDGARQAYEAWIPHLKQGAILILGNSTPRDYAENHDGNWLIASSELSPPRFTDLRRVGWATIAIKAVS